MPNSIQYADQQTLSSLMQLMQLETLSTINCHQVGEIVSFNASNQTAEVQIKMLKPYNGELKSYPILIDCPCIVLGGGKGRITFPIQAGDSCVVLFNDRDIDNWFSGGQTMQPRTNRMHSFSDAIALVGVHNKQNKISDYLNDGTEFKYGNSTIKLQDDKVTITNGSAQIVMNSGSITIVGNVAITGGFTVNGKDVGDTHKHSGVATGTGITGEVV